MLYCTIGDFLSPIFCSGLHQHVTLSADSEIRTTQLVERAEERALAKNMREATIGKVFEISNMIMLFSFQNAILEN